MRRLFGLLALLLAGGPSAAQAAAPAATLDADTLPASAEGATLLHVRTAGRFAITAQSASFTALDLVDMITGPTPLAGAAGSKDGRLDLLLDTGTYKLRTHPAQNATGRVALHVAPFTPAGDTEIAPQNGAERDTTLADLQQRAYWLTVTDHQALRLEAAGRALADLRVWRNGRDLVAVTPVQRQIAPTSGHPLRDFLLTDALPPGLYLVVAYGGPKLPWADGDAAAPFHLRTGLSAALRPGWADSRIGPFGTEAFATAGSDDLVRLSMAGPALLTADGAEAAIDARARLPQAALAMVQTRQDRTVTVTAAEGAAFQLRSQEIGQATGLSGPGDWWVTAASTGFGGDDVPATFILARRHQTAPLEIVASDAPEIGPGAGWRRRFNLRGRVDVLFHAVAGGRIALTISGVPTDTPRLTALDAGTEVPTVGQPDTWDVPAGWYRLSVSPKGKAAGVADMTIGAPGVVAPSGAPSAIEPAGAPSAIVPPGAPDAAVKLGAPGPASPSATFGVQHLAAGESLTLFGNAAPDARFGLTWKTLPLDEAAAPVRVGQAAGQQLDVPMRAGQGTLIALAEGGGPVPVSYDTAHGLAQLPAPDRPREISLFWQAPAPAAAAAMPRPEPEGRRPVLHDQAPRYFDFAEDTARSFSLELAQGGLFRVETLGRLHMRGTIGSHFVPELQSAEANGTGQNMLLQGWLRAGAYHVDVTAKQSFGHAGVVARPAPLASLPPLQPGRVLRAALAAGSGLLVPIDIGQAGSYRLELLGLDRVFEARLEDAEGWPLAASAPLQDTTQDLSPGRYRLLVMPQATDARAVIRLTQNLPPPVRVGHGPHALPFGDPQDYTWREPAGRGDPRTPDDWRFALAAPADVTLSVSDGMDAVLYGADGRQAAHIVGGTPFEGALPPGAWRLEARSQGRNDRLDYRIGLQAAQLQPGLPASVRLPGQVRFNLAAPRVASLTSFGGVPVRAVLRDASGRVLGRYGARADDWNVAISTLLQPGGYTLDLESARPPAQAPAPLNPNDVAASAPAAADASPGSDDTSGGSAAPGQDGNGDTPGQAASGDDTPSQAASGGDTPGQAASDDTPGQDASGDAPAQAASGDAASQDASGGDTPVRVADGDTPGQPAQGDTPAQDAVQSPPPSGDATPDRQESGSGQPEAATTITLSLPDEAPAETLGDATLQLAGGRVHHLGLKQPVAGQLVVAGAEAASPLAVSLERQDGAGAWRSLAGAQGRAAIVAVPADAQPGAWRLSVWPVDGGDAAIRAAARLASLPPAAGPPRFTPFPLPDIADGLAVANVAAAPASLLGIAGDPDVMVAAWPGHAARVPQGGLVAPQGANVWLVASHPARITLAPLPASRPVTLTLAQGEIAGLPRQAGALTAWVAAAQGQPGFAPGPASGVSAGGAIAIVANDTASLRVADDADSLRITANPVALTQAPIRALAGSLDATLPAASATELVLDPARRLLRLALPPGTAAVAGWPDRDSRTVWAGQAPASHTIEGRWRRLLLVNINQAPAAVSVAQDTLAEEDLLGPGHAFRRFFGAAGSLDLAVPAAAGQVLVVAGAADGVFTSQDGRVQRGTRLPLAGPGRLTLEHGTGLVASWLEGPGAVPWPQPAPSRLALPGSIALTGDAMRLSVSQTAPALLRVRTTAPVLLGIAGETPALFPAGAVFSRYVPAGDTSLLVVPAQDGPLSGRLEASASPVLPAQDGLGDAVAAAPGDSVLFGFTLATPRRIGIGAQAEPDGVSLVLLDAAGHEMARGAAMLEDLPAGRYVLQAKVPPDGPATLIRPAIIGLSPRPDGPPPDIVQYYRKLAGLTAHGRKP